MFRNLGRITAYLILFSCICGCAASYRVYTSETPVDLGIPIANVDQIQFYLSEPVTIQYSQPGDRSNDGELYIATDNRERFWKTTVINSKAEGFAVSVSEDRLDVAFEEDVVLGFVSDDEDTPYRLQYLNDQLLREDEPVLFRGEQYDVFFGRRTVKYQEAGDTTRTRDRRRPRLLYRPVSNE